jgi:hypothetical protein
VIPIDSYQLKQSNWRMLFYILDSNTQTVLLEDSNADQLDFSLIKRLTMPFISIIVKSIFSKIKTTSTRDIYICLLLRVLKHIYLNNIIEKDSC